MLTGGSTWALIGFLILVLLVWLGIVAIRHANKGGDDVFTPIGIFAVAIGAIIMIPIVIGTFPWLPKYHVLENHTGKVVKVEARVVTDGSQYAHITKEIAFWMKDEPEAYITDDVRLTDLKEGQSVTINRWGHWVYGGQDYWQITYVSAPQG